MKHTLSILLILVMFTCGCTFYRIDSKEISQDYFVPKTNINDVAYIEKVDKPYTEIGVVTVTTQRNQPLEDVLPKLKQEAAALGADAITDLSSSSPEFWKSLKPQKLLGNAYISTDYTVKAIVWK